MAQSSVLLLGPFQVQHHGDAVTHFRGDKVRALLAYLAVEADRPHPRSELAGLLWPEQPEDQALGNLRQALARLRQALADGEDPLVVTRQTVQWRDGVATVDVLAFLQLARSDAVADLGQAAALYRDELLAGFGLPECEAFEDWLLLTRERLRQQVLDVLQRLGEGYLAAGQLREAVAAARRQLTLDPWREAAYRQLMRGLAQSGDRAGALAAYARCQTVLADELHITPDEETRLLAQQIEAGTLPAGDERPAPAVVPVRTHNLPAPLASLVGRGDELALVRGRLQEADGRLVTVVGAGGSGKSRLALAAAWGLRSQFPDGVWWVELAGIVPVEDPSLERTTVASAVAAALGLTLDGRRPPLDELAGVLAERTALLVLDNCEHLAEVGTVAHTVLESSSGLHLLTTSREPLGLSGETLLPLEGLPIPEEGAPDAGASPAVQLFLDRAARHTPGWGQDRAEVEAAGRLCRVLEGMPLGIELAAHWVGHYAPDEITAAIQADLEFLTARTHDVPERQRSLRAVFAYSWRLLTDVEQQALVRLAVFRGSFDRTAAQAVAGVAATTLVTLVDKSLLRRLAVGRYGLHELLRQFAAERLAEAGETTTLGDRHLVHYLAVAEQAAPELHGPDQRDWLERLDQDLGNLRAALAWARQQEEIEQGLRLAVALHQFWVERGYWREARRWLEAGLEREQDLDPQLHAQALWSLGVLALEVGEHEQAARLLEGAASRFVALGDRAGLTRTLTQRGIAAFRRGAYDQATAFLAEGLQLAEELGDRQESALALLNLGLVALHQGNLPVARDRYEAALALARARGDAYIIILTLKFIADVSFEEGKLEEAETRLQEVLARARELASKREMAYALCNLGDVATQRGRYERAAEYLRESVLMARELGDTYLLLGTLAEHAKLAVAWGQAERAARLAGAETKLRDERGIALPVGELARREQALTHARAQLGEEAFQRAWATGQAMELEEAVTYALDRGTEATVGPLDHTPDTATASLT
jgi:predicted ATPase/DNA-binding SARP family transcriptional activator/Tfp pilus assembly protein PilF